MWKCIAHLIYSSTKVENQQVKWNAYQLFIQAANSFYAFILTACDCHHHHHHHYHHHHHHRHHHYHYHYQVYFKRYASIIDENFKIFWFKPDRSWSGADLSKESSFAHGVKDNGLIVLRNNFHSATVDKIHLQV